MLVPASGAAVVRRGTYSIRLLGHPATCALGVLGVASIALPLGVIAGAMMLAAMLLAVWCVAGHVGVQRTLDQRRLLARAREQRCRRETRLQEANVSSLEICELNSLVAEIERTSPAEAERYELEALLERYVELSLAHARSEHTLVDGNISARALALLDRNDPNTRQRREVLERQVAWFHAHRMRLEGLREEMLLIAELIRLIALRSSTRQPVSAMDEIERRLLEIEADDAAFDELARS